MRYRFVDEIVSLTLDGAPQIEVVKRFMFVCVSVPGIDLAARGVGV